MSEERDAIKDFIAKSREKIEHDEISREELKKLALNLLNLYEGEVSAKDENWADLGGRVNSLDDEEDFGYDERY